MLATGGRSTVTDDEPITPSTSAKMKTVPGDTPMTTPFASTVATAFAPLVHRVSRPVSTAPVVERAVAVSVVVRPVRIVAVPGVTVTDVTGTDVTCTAADPVRPSLVAMTFTFPGATPVTTPSLLTVATDAFPVLQLTTRPPSMLPWLSRNVAPSVTVDPTCTVLNCGETATELTGRASTVTSAVPLFPSLLAVMVALPGESAVTVEGAYDRIPFEMAHAGAVFGAGRALGYGALSSESAATVIVAVALPLLLAGLAKAGVGGAAIGPIGPDVAVDRLMADGEHTEVTQPAETGCNV